MHGRAEDKSTSPCTQQQQVSTFMGMLISSRICHRLVHDAQKAKHRETISTLHRADGGSLSLSSSGMGVGLGVAVAAVGAFRCSSLRSLLWCEV
ncbi:hypothetical protein BJX66DRAFT_316607 [Aspergillus keveii]|jgi:hypothetical protein|uniref:Uncharacterized protein n=1 Tax=Aspergillus keveii TaxID=714993 RepID=A0ABR4FMG4_9EURO